MLDIGAIGPPVFFDALLVTKLLLTGVLLVSKKLLTGRLPVSKEFTGILPVNNFNLFWSVFFFYFAYLSFFIFLTDIVHDFLLTRSTPVNISLVTEVRQKIPVAQWP